MNTPLVKTRRRALGRALIRWAFFLAATALALPLLQWPRSVQVLPALSPFIVLGSALARRSLALVLPPALLVLALVMLRQRLLCRYVCPVGLLNDQAARLRPGARGRFVRLPRLGTWLALLTLGGAALGYPLFLWLDPFTIFNGALGAWHKPFVLASAVPAFVLLFIILLSALWPGTWCQRLCPLGALQDLLAAPRRFLAKASNAECGMRNAESTDCGLRIADCELKTGNADVSSATMLPHAESSSAAPGNLQSNNPQSAIHNPQSSSRIPHSAFRIPVPRRALLGLGVGGGWALLTRRNLAHATPEALPILPPGAVERRTFNGLCIRCGACVRACPHRIIRPSTGQHGLAALLTPTLNFEQDYCRPDCVACTRVCPSGALRPLLLKEKTKIRLARPVVNRETCLQVQSGNCNECANACYFDAIHGSAPREGDIGGEPVVDLKRCIGCGACEMICPAQPRAIVMRGED